MPELGVRPPPGHARRMVALAALSFFSGLPLGLHTESLPVWLKDSGVSNEAIGLFSLAGYPWSLKFLWAPILDWVALPFLDRRRSWSVAAQIGLMVAIAALAFTRPSESLLLVIVVTWMMTFASATYDISVDAYAVDVMHPSEHGRGNGLRVSSYRIAMLVTGGLAIWMADYFPWRAVLLVVSALYGIGILATMGAPPIPRAARPLFDFGQAVVDPLRDLFRRRRIVSVLAFIVCFKLADAIAATMFRPYLRDAGYSGAEIGIATKTVGVAATILGTLLGGFGLGRLGLGPSLFIFGALGGASNVGYGFSALHPASRPLMYVAVFVENLTGGFATTALLALLTRLTSRKHSATQFALLSSLMSQGRQLSGAASGFLQHALGYPRFFFITSLFAAPALLLLLRFASPFRRDLFPGVAAEQDEGNSPVLSSSSEGP